MVKNMEPNFDELAQIGMEFTLPRVDNRQATKEEIKHLREEGMKIQELADRYNCSVGKIHKLINE